MYVKRKMTANPYCLSPENTVSEAIELFRDKGITRAPVVDKNKKLLGLITHKRLLEISPSPATTLSVYEISYLLNKTKINKLMVKEVLKVKPDSLIEEAALIMREHKIGGLPVVDDNDKVIGIITEGDIFDSFIETMGFKDKGARLVLQIFDNSPGNLAKISKIIADADINITHITVLDDEIILRVNSINVDGIVTELEKIGFKDIDVTINE